MVGKTSPNASTTKASEKDFWRTPLNLQLDALALIGYEWFGIDLACTKKIDKAIEYIDEERDFFKFVIEKNSVGLPAFCNPPFSKKYEFFEGCKTFVHNNKTPCMFIMPYEPASKVWRDHVSPSNCIVYVPDGRYNYLRPDGSKASSATFSTALIYIVPHYTGGEIIINFERGIGND